MRMGLRPLAICLVVAVGGQVFASGETKMLCRYTGKVLELPCPCPSDESATVPTLQKQSCCELLNTSPLPAAKNDANAPVLLRVQSSFLAVPVRGPALKPVEVEVERFNAWAQAPPPPTSRLFVKLRQLLI